MTPKIVAIGAVLVLSGVLLGMNYPIADALWRGGPYALSPDTALCRFPNVPKLGPVGSR